MTDVSSRLSCEKFFRAAWECDIVQNSRQQEIPETKISQIYDIASILNQFWAYVRQLEKFSMDTKVGDFIIR